MSSVLHSGVVGFILGFYLIVYIATLTVAIGSMNFQKQSYDLNCYYYGQCVAFFIIIPAMAIAFSSVAIILAITQISLFSKRRLTRNMFFYLDLAVTILWIPVIAIGWAPQTEYYDYSIGDYTFGVTGWFIGVYQDFITYNQQRGYYSYDYTQNDITQINFNMALLVMSCVTFGLVAFMTICGLIACIVDKKNPTGNAAPGMVDSRHQWPGPVSPMPQQSPHTWSSEPAEAKPPWIATTGQHEMYYQAGQGRDQYGGQRPALYPGT